MSEYGDRENRIKGCIVQVNNDTLPMHVPWDTSHQDIIDVLSSRGLVVQSIEMAEPDFELVKAWDPVGSKVNDLWLMRSSIERYIKEQVNGRRVPEAGADGESGHNPTDDDPALD